ncbi:MAG: hypothetical protein ACE5F1_01370 [Planctomycetota bacterium]
MLILAIASGIVGWYWMLFATFRVSRRWGWGFFSLPLAALPFAVLYWEEARSPFLLLLLACGCGYVSTLV